MPNPLFIQLSQAEADAGKAALQADIVTGGIDGIVVAVAGQIANYSFNQIPLGRQAEFDASDDEKKTKFFEFSETAMTSKYAGVDFVTAWEAEYEIFYG